MHRWIARLLVLAMAIPAFGPLALAAAQKPEAPHCVRKAAKPPMQCHPGMTMAPGQPSSETSETSFHAGDSCCKNHDCCRGMGAPQWAQPQARLFAHQGLLAVEAALASSVLIKPSSPDDNDSARAPPRS